MLNSPSKDRIDTARRMPVLRLIALEQGSPPDQQELQLRNLHFGCERAGKEDIMVLFRPEVRDHADDKIAVSEFQCFLRVRCLRLSRWSKGFSIHAVVDLDNITMVDSLSLDNRLPYT